MIALLGPPPKEILKRVEYMSKLDFHKPITIENKKDCKNAREVYSGPYFDQEGWYRVKFFDNAC
jgi:hypothetical protein